MNDPSRLNQVGGARAQRTIKRLYETDANGIYDEELIDEVGWALYRAATVSSSPPARGRAERGASGCGETLWRTDPQRDGSDVLRCEKCGWSVTWRIYFRSIQHKQLSGARTVVAFFQEFMARFPAAEGPRQKMLLIDWLIHRFHSENRDPTRPVGVNLIEGKITRTRSSPSSTA